MKRYLQLALFLFFALFLTVETQAQCDAPVNLNDVVGGGGGGVNTVDLSWDAVTGADFYSVRYRVQGSMDPWSVKNVSTNMTTVSGLASSTTFEWKVLAVCEPDWSEVSEFSALDSFTTGVGASCTEVTDLAASNISDSSADLTWTPGTGAIQYYIQYRDIATQSWAEADFIFTFLPTGKTITGLTAGTDYEVRVRTICAPDWSSISEYSEIISFTTDGCIIPTNLVSTPDQFSADLSWDAVPGAVEYELRWRALGSMVWTNGKTVTGTTTSINNLTPSTDYEWIIRTVCSSAPFEASDYSAIQSFQTLAGTTCDTPVNLNSTPAAVSADLTWDAVASALEYEVKWRVSGGMIWTNTAFVSTNSATINNLDPLTNYEWIIRSVCTMDRLTNSDFSAIQNFMTIAGATCDVPTTLTATPAANSALLSWDAMPLALNYDVRWRVQGSPTYTNQQVTSNTNITINSLAASTTYEWIVKTLCSADESFDSDFSTVQTFTTLAGITCVVPGNLTANPDVNSADLSWDAVVGALNYEIKYRETGTTEYLKRVETSNTFATIINLQGGTGYDWIIRTLCSGDGSNDSPYSSVQNFTTDPGTTCDIPSNLGATPSSNSVTVTWDAVPAALEYELKWRPQGSPNWTNGKIIPATTSTNFNNLTASTTYEWIIRSFCSVDRVLKSDFSAVQMFTTTAGGGRVLNDIEAALNEERETPEATISDFSIYPNPSRGVLNIEFASDDFGSKDVLLYNSVGKIITKFEAEPNRVNTFQLNGVPSGVYLVKLMVNSKPIIKRVIVQ